MNRVAHNDGMGGRSPLGRLTGKNRLAVRDTFETRKQVERNPIFCELVHTASRI